VNSLAATIKPAINLLKGKPILAVFEVCLRCNSACGYCNLPLNEGRYEMSRSEIARVFEGLYRDGVRLLFIQGGEPLLRRDLADVLEDLAGIGFMLTLITNGTKLTEALVGRLASLPLSYSISLDTLDRERYRKIRGADQLEQVLGGVALVARAPNPKFLTCIVSDVNRGDVLDVVRFARARGFVPIVGAYHWGLDRYGKVDPTLQYERAQAAAVFREVAQSGLIPSGYYRRYVQGNIDWLENRALSPCDAGRYSIAVDASGNVAPCLALPQAGNLLESPLDEILGRFDRAGIDACSARSSCNMLCSRVVGSVLRHPIAALRTPLSLAPEAPS
jgi:MoaA/NifB/PqqE/SkfB family radical SAM enzyme